MRLNIYPVNKAGGKAFLACLNPNSLEVLTGCKVEVSPKDSFKPGK